MASSPLTRLQRVEQAMLMQVVTEALARARRGPRADFASSLMRWLPGNQDTFALDFCLLSDEEVELLSQWEGE
jgi:hypothetical protein